MKKDQILSVLLVVYAVLITASLLFGALRENWTQEQNEPGGYSMMVERSGIDGDASFSITLYEPGGGAVLRLDADHVSGTAEAPVYQYGLTWLDEVELTITEVWRQ